MSDEATEFWTPEPIFDLKTVFVLGGGPSLRDLDPDRLRDRSIFVTNMSIYLCPWANALFFMDTHWFEANQAAVEAFNGLRITSSRQVRRDHPEKIKRVEFVPSDEFTFGTPRLKFSRTSGHAAITLAIAMGAVRVVLLGFDMRLVDGRSHFHDAYGTKDHNVFANDFLANFDGWNEAARRCGVRIINCTPGSALTEFPTGSLDEELAACS